MSNSIRFSGSHKALLPAALSLALLSMSAHAGNAWVSTRTHAGIHAGSTHVSTLTMTGHPSIDAKQIMPLELSKPLHVEVSLNLRNADQLQSFLQAVNQHVVELRGPDDLANRQSAEAIKQPHLSGLAGV